MILLFDFDGTIHDTKHLYGCAFRKAYEMLVENGMANERYYTDDEVSKYLGVSAPDMWNSFMPELPDEMKHSASMLIGKEMIDGVLNGQAVLYDGIIEVLSELKSRGCRLMILSNCRRSYMDAHRRASGLDRFFEDYFCAEEYGFIPKHEIFLHIKKKYPGCTFIMTGDRASDIEVGRRNSLPAIGCLYGFAAPGELDQADMLASSPADIPGCVTSVTSVTSVMLDPCSRRLINK
ncbi:MAG: HAD family hydrolase [Clostridia bacterium]|nr:HAD family hydrolase [Clostridia bacterium]